MPSWRNHEHASQCLSSLEIGSSISSCRIIEADKVRRLSFGITTHSAMDETGDFCKRKGKLPEKIYFHQAISRSLKAHEIKVILA